MPFGVGPHRCPGEDLANALVAGVIRALSEHNYRFDVSLVQVDANGVPTRFTMEAPDDRDQ